MEKKILVAVDASPQSRAAVRYATKISADLKKFSYVLVTVEPSVSLFLKDEAGKSLKAQQELDQVMHGNLLCCRDLLETLQQYMISLGIAESRISVLTLPRRLGIAKDIIDYAQQKHLDAIVIGRRGVTAIQEFFMGSVSNAILQNAAVTPVWIIGGDIDPNKVLVPVDGSECSLRAIDHLAFMLGGQPRRKLTLFHVRPRLRDFCGIDFDTDKTEELELALDRSDTRCIDDFYAKACRKFADFGIDESRVQIKTARGFFNPGAEIVKEICAEGYDTIIMGRRGISGSFFTGSVTHYVINKAPERAIWIVP